MAYAVQTSVYEGPFDLLLHLIFREQVDIYDVSLAAIVDAYMVELGRMETLDLEIATEFLLIAATLVELKARRLLPDLDDGDLDDELALWEERDLLLARLLECKTFKDAAAVLALRAQAAARSFPRTAGLEDRFNDLTPDLLEGVGPPDLLAAYYRGITPRLVPTVETSHIHIVRVTVLEAVEELADELPRVGRIGFRELTGQFVERIEVVVRFLALLELFKQGLVELDQAIAFGDIQIIWTGGAGGDDDDTPLGGRLGAAPDLASVDAYEG